MGSKNRLSRRKTSVNNGDLTEVFIRLEKQVARHFNQITAYICYRAMNSRRQSKRVKSQGVQSSQTENPATFSPEDEPAIEEFCHLVATIVVRILASEGQEAYNGNRSDQREASER